MTFKAASDWVDAWPEEPDPVTPKLPPARPRTRKTPVETSPVLVPLPEPARDTGKDTAARPDEIDTVDQAPSQSASEAAAIPCAVGYKKPPIHSRFKPGQSGNPKGRPRAAKGLKTIARETLTQKITVRTASGEKRITRIEAVLQKTIEQALKGNPRALAELLKLYANSVPDAPSETITPAEEDLTATDLAMLEALRTQLMNQQETDHDPL